jgi:transcriptional regulator with XRE-family HTH domain
MECCYMTSRKDSDSLQEAFDDINASLDELRETLYDIAAHEEPLSPLLEDDLEGALSSALNTALAARSLRRSRAVLDDGSAFVVSLGGVLARALKTLRERAHITQEALAIQMRRVGFTNWKRITVAEVESAKRKLSLEELVGLAILFDVPVGFLLSAFDSDEVVQLNESLTVTTAQAQELITGRPIDTAWHGIRLVATATGRVIGTDFGEVEEDWRPAGEQGVIWAGAKEGEDGTMVLRNFSGPVP